MYTFFGYCTPYALHNRYKKTNRSKVDAIPLVTPTTSIDISIRVCPLTPGLTRAMSRNDLSSVSTHTDRRLRTSLIAFVTEEERVDPAWRSTRKKTILIAAQLLIRAVKMHECQGSD